MSQDPAGQPKNVTDGQDVSALLKVSKGSSFIPAILTVIAGLLFMAVWLPPSKNLLLAEFDRYCDVVAGKPTARVAPVDAKDHATGESAMRAPDGAQKSESGGGDKAPLTELSLQPSNYRAICASKGNIAAER